MNSTSIPSIHSILTDLATTASRNEKIRILEQNKNNVLLQKVLVAAYDPFVNYWMKGDSFVFQNSFSGEISLEEALVRLNDISERKVTGNAALDLIENLSSSLSSHEEATVLKQIIDKDLRCGISAKTINKVWKKLIPEFSVMLCSKAESKTIKKIKFPAFVQKKEDGARLITFIDPDNQTVEFFSRNGKPVDLLGRFEDELLNAATQLNQGAVVLDGEILSRGEVQGSVMNRQTGNGLMTKAIRGTLIPPEAEQMIMVLWDIIPLNHFQKGYSAIPYKERFQTLTDFCFRGNFLGKETSVQLIDSVLAVSLKEVEKLFDYYLKKGHEGIILKDREGPFEGKRVQHQIKFKEKKTADLQIIDFLEGTGKNKGLLGALVGTTSCGQLKVGVGTGLSDEQRSMFWNKKDELMGAVFEVEYNAQIEDKKTKEKSLFLPVFKCLRDDKTTANTLEELA